MIRLGKLTDYGIVLLTHFARNDEEAVWTVPQLAQRTHIPEPTVSKVLKILTRAEILISHRGVNGGYALARRSDQISVIDIIRAMEGPIALMECTEDTGGQCQQEMTCPVKSHWQIINLAVREALANLTLRDMTVPLPPERVRVPEVRDTGETATMRKT